MKAYIAGPMRGYVDFNKRAFDRAEGFLLSVGYEVMNPHKMDTDNGIDMVSNSGIQVGWSGGMAPAVRGSPRWARVDWAR